MLTRIVAVGEKIAGGFDSEERGAQHQERAIEGASIEGDELSVVTHCFPELL